MVEAPAIVVIAAGTPLPFDAVDAGLQRCATRQALIERLRELPALADGRDLAVEAPGWCTPAEVVAVQALAVAAGARILVGADTASAQRVAAVAGAVVAARDGGSGR